MSSQQTTGSEPSTATETSGTPKPLPKSVMIPESLRTAQATLLKREAATDEARKLRNAEVARLRDEENVSQYRIAKWLDVTERAVMLMAKQGREQMQNSESEAQNN